MVGEDRVHNKTIYQAKKTANYLVDIFDELPHGIIDKTETGVGATSLEISAHRHSIIVEPLKVTAALKSKNTPGSIYVGSEINGKKKTTTTEEIKKYLQSAENVSGYKKIFCTTDSLLKVMNALPSGFDCFLLVDESDTLQQDSKFRKKMECVLDVYKSFPKDKRALITATQIEFTDPDLAAEPKHQILWDRENQPIVTLHNSEHPLCTAAEKVLELFEKSKSKEENSEKFEPIVFALNNVTELRQLADYLVKNKIPKEDITILCGKNSRFTAAL